MVHGDSSKRRLPMWRTVVEAYALTYRNLPYLLRMSWAWVLLTIPVALAYHSLAFKLGWINSDAAALGSQVDLILSTLLYLPLLASIAVAWHRKLLADEVWAGRFYLRLDGTVAAYLGLAALISFLVTAPVYAMPALAEYAATGGWIDWLVLVWVVVLGLGLFVSTRIWLALPARALGRSEFALRQAWQVSYRNFWRLIGGCCLCAIPVCVVVIVSVVWDLDLDWAKAERAIEYAAWQTLFELVTTFVTAMPVVSFLSLSYRHLVEGDGVGASPARA